MASGFFRVLTKVVRISLYFFVEPSSDLNLVPKGENPTPIATINVDAAEQGQ